PASDCARAARSPTTTAVLFRTRSRNDAQRTDAAAAIAILFRKLPPSHFLPAIVMMRVRSNAHQKRLSGGVMRREIPGQAGYYREQASRVRKRAELALTQEQRESLLELAQRWDRLAVGTEPAGLSEKN